MAIGDYWRKRVERKERVEQWRVHYAALPKLSDISTESRELDKQIGEKKTKLATALPGEVKGLNLELEVLQEQKEGCGMALADKNAAEGKKFRGWEH